ncbi:MAG: hypothetical protein IKF68_01845, partial [Erysipelotrichaceae bacterium]|nr:hypothetical protein [Erysipelotrichaceae bacterium]
MKNKCLKVLTLLMAVILVLTVGTSNVAKAENQSLAEYGYEIEDNMIPFNFKKENLQVPEGWTYGTQSNPLIPKEFGENYDFYYPESLNYFGEWLNVNVNVEYYGTNDYQNYMDADNNWSGIWAGSGGDHPNSVCLRTFGTDYKITITFTDKNGDPFKFTGATLFVDPDESNYLEFTSDEIYYVNVGNNQFKHSGIDLPNNTLPANTLMLADYYEYDPTFGLLRKDSEYDKADTWVPFDNGSFGVLIKESSEFTYIINGKDDWIYLPDFFIVYVPYNIEYYYMLDDGTYPETPDYPTEDEDKYSEQYRRGPVYILEENEKGILDVMNPLPSVSVED